MRLIYILFLGVIIVYGCSPKVVEVNQDVQEDNVDKIKEPEVETTLCTTFSKLSPRDKDIAETSYVLYRDLVKLEKFSEALPYWKTGFSLAPAADGKIRYHFDDGLKIYNYFFDHAEESRKQFYVDTIMGIYQQREMCYPDEADHLAGRKAFDQYYYYHDFASEGKIYDNFKQSIDSDPENIDYYIINPFTKLLFDGISSGSINNDEGRKYATYLMAAIEKGVDNCKGSDCETWEIISSYAPARLEALEGVDGLYDCDYYAGKYYPIFQASSSACEAIQLAYIRMVRGNCDSEDPRMLEVKEAYNKNCKKATPSKGTLKIAYDLYTSGDYKAAVLKFDEYITETIDVEQKAKYLFVISKIYYRDIKNFPKAREYALKAAKIKPGWGDPYILIGKLYASSGPLCGPGTGFDSQVVTWVAVDKFLHAKSIDPSVSEEANKWINDYSKFYPSKGDVFLRSIEEGSIYKIGCWIQEKTVVRVVK